MPIQRRSVMELALRSSAAYRNPFLDVELEATFTAPDGATRTMPGFFDGQGTWRVRFSPHIAGTWRYRTATPIGDPDLATSGEFEVVEPAGQVRGFLRTCPGRGWGLEWESGEPCLVLGDTMYNLFGVAHCGLDVEAVLRRRAAQGFNLVRARVPVSPFHPPDGYSDWQTCSTWPWGGSHQRPLFDRFNLDYFRSVDRVVRLAAELGIGLEMIMEAWGFEYPFNERSRFTPEYEELWMRYLIARYDAYASVAVWTLMNEYEFYPDGNWNYNPDADLWAIRMGRWVKRTAPHGHIVAVHNGPRLPRFADRFRRAPGVIDLIMFQDWGTRDAENGWLAIGIEEIMTQALEGWPGAFIFAEWGYERNPDLDMRMPSHTYCDPEHTRRGAWRGLFCATGIIHGWENTWGPWWVPGSDQAGMKYLLIARDLFRDIVPFHRLAPDRARVVSGGAVQPGTQPLCLSSTEGDWVLAYLPVSAPVTLRLAGEAYDGEWFDPRTGARHPLRGKVGGETTFTPPTAGRDDWALVLHR